MSHAFLIDANLPIALARALAAAGHPATHVTDHVAADMDDRDVWALASSRSEVIVSKDADFAVMTRADGERPSVVWVRMGNTRKQHVVSHFVAVIPRIIRALDAGERLVEVR